MVEERIAENICPAISAGMLMISRLEGPCKKCTAKTFLPFQDAPDGNRGRGNNRPWHGVVPQD